jgi:hypothetical protein
MIKLGARLENIKRALATKVTRHRPKVCSSVVVASSRKAYIAVWRLRRIEPTSAYDRKMLVVLTVNTRPNIRASLTTVAHILVLRSQ